MYSHQSSSSKYHLDTMFVVLCVIVGVTSHTISDTSKKPINQFNVFYRKSFIDFIMDPNLTKILQSTNTVNGNLVIKQSNSKLIDAPFIQRSATVCAHLSNLLGGDQVRFCQRHQDVLESILPRVIQTMERECKRITKNLKWNCSSFSFLFDKSSSLAYTREAALVRSILNASIMYLAARVCSENGHRSCGCLSNYHQPSATAHDPMTPQPAGTRFGRYDPNSGQDNLASYQSLSSNELSLTELSLLNSGSPVRLKDSVEQRQGCLINTAFADAFTKVFVDSDDIKALNKAHRILNGDLSANQPQPRRSSIRRPVDNEYKDLASIRWTKAAINLHNNHIGRKVVREATLKRCRCHGLSGSCQFQTCWEQLEDLGTITSRLKSIYINRAAKAGYKNMGSSERPDLYLTRVVEDRNRTYDSLSPRLMSVQHGGDDTWISRIGSEELLYINDSPEYCESQPELGHTGTSGRVCIPSSNVTLSYSRKVGRTKSVDSFDRIPQDTSVEEEEGPGSCERLCCDRGYHRELVLDVVPCNCRFKFCCRIECENCLRQTNQHYCL